MSTNEKQSELLDSSKGLNPLQKTGGFLKKCREEKNLSIEKLAESLHLGKEQLIALENGEENLLPEPVFIRAMVRRVAEKLEIGEDKILAILEDPDVSSG